MTRFEMYTKLMALHPGAELEWTDSWYDLGPAAIVHVYQRLTDGTRLRVDARLLREELPDA